MKGRDDDDDDGVGGYRLGEQNSTRFFNRLTALLKSKRRCSVTMVRRISPAWSRAPLPSSRNLRRRARARPGASSPHREKSKVGR